MDEDLITKKELLELTGISYGALYRWKRMRLLPEDWFIRRSTYTGHETYFPREKTLTRVAEIQKLKETMSLEEIARQFSPQPSGELHMTPSEASDAGVAPPPILNQYLAVKSREDLDYTGVLELFVFSRLIQEGKLTRDEALEAAEAAAEAGTGDISEPVVYLYRKYGVSFCVTAGESRNITFDRQATLAATIPVSSEKAALSALLKQKGVSL